MKVRDLDQTSHAGEETEPDVEDVRRLKITSFILARLQQEASSGTGPTELEAISSPLKGTKGRMSVSSAGFKIVFVLLSNDLPPSPLLDRPPAALIPVSITRRSQNTNHE